MNKLIALLALTAATPAIAQDKTPLWNNLEAGMSKAEVEALYPRGGKDHINLTPDCWGDISFDYKDGKLTGVRMENTTKDRGSTCGTTIALTIGQKYGEAEAQQFETRYSRIVGIVRDVYTKWLTPDGVKVMLLMTEGSSMRWTATWSRVDEPVANEQAASKL